MPEPGQVAFYLATTFDNGSESGLADGSDVELRPNTNPCTGF